MSAIDWRYVLLEDAGIPYKLPYSTQCKFNLLNTSVRDLCTQQRCAGCHMPLLAVDDDDTNEKGEFRVVALRGVNGAIVQTLVHHAKHEPKHSCEAGQIVFASSSSSSSNVSLLMDRCFSALLAQVYLAPIEEQRVIVPPPHEKIEKGNVRAFMLQCVAPFLPFLLLSAESRNAHKQPRMEFCWGYNFEKKCVGFRISGEAEIKAVEQLDVVQPFVDMRNCALVVCQVRVESVEGEKVSLAPEQIALEIREYIEQTFKCPSAAVFANNTEVVFLNNINKYVPSTTTFKCRCNNAIRITLVKDIQRSRAIVTHNKQYLDWNVQQVHLNDIYYQVETTSSSSSSSGQNKFSRTEHLGDTVLMPIITAYP